MEELEKVRSEALEAIRSNMKNKRNSYDRYHKEKAWWTALDCISLITAATTESQMRLAMSIYVRYKYLI